jgi:hypothetical protein
MEAARSCETLVSIYRTTQCYIPQDSHLIVLEFALSCIWLRLSVQKKCKYEESILIRLTLMPLQFIYKVSSVYQFWYVRVKLRVKWS